MSEAETQPREDETEAGAYPVLSPETLRGLVAGETAALEEFFEAYFDRIYGYVRRLVQREHLAEDLTQEIFLHLQQAFAKYDPTRDLRPWVFTIATNKVRDFWRSRQHRDTQLERSVERDDDFRIDLPSSADGPEVSLSREEIGESVRQAVDELPEGLRVTVVLRVFEGLSFEAIGEIVERNEVAVRKRYSRALEALRQVLPENFGEEL